MRHLNRSNTTTPDALQPHAARWAVIIFLTALAVRGTHVWESADSPVFLAPIVDSETYDAHARQIATTGQLPDTLFWQPVFYPLWLAAIYALSGSSIVFAKIIQVLIGSVTCIVVWRLGRRVFDERVGRAAGLIAALYGPLVFFDAELLGTGWACLWSAVLLLTVFRLRDQLTLLNVALVGAAIGFSVVTRPTFLVPTVAIAGWCAWQLIRADLRPAQAAGHMAILGVACAVVVLPVSALSHNITGRFSFLPTSGGVNLYIGNNPDMQTTIAARPGWDWDELTRMPVHSDPPVSDAGLFFKERVTTYIRSQPLQFVGGLGSKSVQFVSSRELPRNVDPYLHRQWSSVLSILLGRLGPWGWPCGLLWIAVLAGMWTRPRQSAGLLLFAALYAGAVIAVFVTSRYRMPVIPALCPIAAAGVCAAIDWVRERQWRPLAALVGGAMPLTALATLPGPFPQEATNYEAEMYYLLASQARKAEQPDDARAWLTQALALRPDYADAHNSMGTILQDQGRLQEAAQHYTDALKCNPNHGTAHANAARALVKLGQAGPAEQHFRRALEIMPWDAGLHTSAAILLAQSGRLREALPHFEAAYRLAPQDANKLSNLGGILRELGRHEEAIALFEAALARRPDHYEAALNLLTLLREIGQLDRARQTLERLTRAAQQAGHDAFVQRITQAVGEL